MAAASAHSASTGSGADDSASPATKPRLPSWVYKMPRNAYDEGVCRRRVEWSYTHGKTMPPSHFWRRPSAQCRADIQTVLRTTSAPHVIFLREAMKKLGCPRVYDNNQNTLCVSCPMALGGGYHPPSKQVRKS